MSSDNVCTHCGFANRSVAKFCSHCGYPVYETAQDITQITPMRLPLLHQRYRLASKIGEGGFGAVYKAEDHTLNKAPRAVKEMCVQGLDQQEIQQAQLSFQQEACLLAALHHPNLPRVYDHFEHQGRWYLVMDFIEGSTVEACLNQAPGGRLPFPRVLHIAQQLCSVLSYLHSRQPPIIFRDLKPANIMLTEDDHVYLIDFGIARLFKHGQQKDTVVMGSPGYAAPEQYGKGQTTERADIYSLGATLHHLLSGQDPSNHPFTFSPLDLSRYAPAGPTLAGLIERMLEVDAHKRPPTVQEIRQALQEIAQQPVKANVYKVQSNKSSVQSRDLQWSVCEAHWKKQEPVTGKVIYAKNTGLVVDIDGLRGFVTRGHLSSVHGRKVTEQDLQAFVGQTLQLYVLEIDRTRNRLMLADRLIKQRAPQTNGSLAHQKTSKHEQDERASIGEEAEIYALQIIQARPEHAFIRGPLLLLPQGGYRESDFLLYTGGVLFCIEVKNWLGSVSYPLLPSGQGQYDYTHVLHQGKPRKDGNAPFDRIYKHPLEKTKRFITDLKAYVSQKEPRFAGLHIIPAVAFTHRADISAIHDFQAGIISLGELQSFLDYHIRHQGFMQAPQQWIVDTVLYKIPNWDRIQMHNGTWERGILAGQATFTALDGGIRKLPPWSTIRSIEWHAVPGSPSLSMTVVSINDTRSTYQCRDGHIQLSSEPGTPPQTYVMRRVQRLVVGIANKG